MTAARSDFNQTVIEEFRANGGVVGGPFEGMQLLILHHRGAKSDVERVSPLAYLEDGGRYAVFGSKGGAPTNPDWYHNLKAHPEVTVELGTRHSRARAEEVTGAERDRLYSTLAQRRPQFAEYERQTARKIPVVILTPLD
jgi:deazaflavin-dependent oxidoreductase (nitroreductase family)